MEQDRFQVAAARAESAYSSETWHTMDIGAQARAIYRELRQLDLDAVESDRSVSGQRAGGSNPSSPARGRRMAGAAVPA